MTSLVKEVRDYFERMTVGALYEYKTHGDSLHSTIYTF